jgi:4-hydroxybenzoate polyprenyltransferase
MSHGIRNKIKAYIDLIRPFTMVPPAVGVLAGGLLAIGYYQRLSLKTPLGLAGFNFLPLFFGAVLYSIFNGASNAYNQVFDLEIDRINRPERPIPSNRISVREALTFTLIVYTLGLITAFFISFPFFLVTSCCLIITTLYSTPPFWLKKRFLVANITIALCQSWLFILAGWVIYPFGNPFEPTFWFIGLVLFILLVGACGTKDLITGPFFVFPFLLIPIGCALGILSNKAFILTVLVVYGLYVSLNLKNLAKPRGSKENSRAWLHYYLMLMSLELGFSFVYLT